MVTAEKIHVKSQFRKQNPVLPMEQFSSLAQPKSAIMFQHLVIQFSLCYLPSARLTEVKHKINFPTFSSKSGRGRLREVVAYNGFQISWLILTWKLLVFGSLVPEDGCSREINSDVVIDWQLPFFFFF